ncbi:MAG: T9SS type A sorting domain-containing protein [Chitinophagaceae bacterium]
MNKLLQILLIFLLFPFMVKGQIITPIIKANFGVDADLRSNYFNGFVQSGNDDWFKLPGSVGTGEYIIDTTGAAAILAGYTTDPTTRNLPFYKGMRFPAYSKVNNRLLVDAVYVRDYHGDDSTIFASGSNKNGMSPQDWSCPVSQSVPDKNEIMEMMLHVRRAGPTVADSLWMMGAISIESTTGNRYFDFEMYQTDIYYDRTTRKFYNYGPDAGHTSWVFDAGGNMTKPGDIILTAEYGSSSLTMIEARIWVNKNDLAITPVGFDWTGIFDGASNGAQFGYAGIKPKTAGAFYTGLQCGNSTWAGPFSFVLGNNTIQTNYIARQYMEFSVNLSKLGLDKAEIYGGDDCAQPFRRVVVKTRASTSFTAELKDFVAPFDFFLAPRANVETEIPNLCDTVGVSNIYVSNPIPSSIYQWSTPDGHIVGITTGSSIYVDSPGVYIVTQYLNVGCSVYATDTITIGRLTNCIALASNISLLETQLKNDKIVLQWKMLENNTVNYFQIERSNDGVQFNVINRIESNRLQSGTVDYSFLDDLPDNGIIKIYYRVRVFENDNKHFLSNIAVQKIKKNLTVGLQVFPNPVKHNMHLTIISSENSKADISVFDNYGKKIGQQAIQLFEGINNIESKLLSDKQPGLYRVILVTDKNRYSTTAIVVN